VSAVEWTAILGALATVISTVIVPAILRRRKAIRDNSSGQLANWQSFTSSLDQDRRDVRKERDELQEKLDTVTADHRRRIEESDADHSRQLQELDAKWRAKDVISDKRIASLERDLARVYAELGRQNTRLGTTEQDDPK